MRRKASAQRAPRFSTKVWAIIKSNLQEYGCHILNISESGAYVMVPPSCKLEAGELLFQAARGNVVSLKFKTKRTEVWSEGLERASANTKGLGIEFEKPIEGSAFASIAIGPIEAAVTTN